MQVCHLNSYSVSDTLCGHDIPTSFWLISKRWEQLTIKPTIAVHVGRPKLQKIPITVTVHCHGNIRRQHRNYVLYLPNFQLTINFTFHNTLYTLYHLSKFGTANLLHHTGNSVVFPMTNRQPPASGLATVPHSGMSIKSGTDRDVRMNFTETITSR